MKVLAWPINILEDLDVKFDNSFNTSPSAFIIVHFSVRNRSSEPRRCTSHSKTIMATSHPPPLIPVPAPPLNIAGWTCTGITCGSQVKYTCQKSCSDTLFLTRYEFEHLLKPHFWILAIIILYIVDGASAEDSYQFILKKVAKLRPRSTGWPQPRSRVTQIGALLAYLGILWLVWIEASMVLSTDWRMARKVFVVWRPSLTPLRLRLLMLYPVWVMISAFCMAVIAFTLLAGVIIAKVHLTCIADVAFLVIGRRTLDETQRIRELPREKDTSGHENNNLDKSLDEEGDMKMPGPTC
ncbi:hypothetical protein GGR51DRAFT_569179 [Nemania sp. FL0031]|nr:hypothetical protein GGR51DRAFT_569179 [Nemania sp. FL0031]